MGIIGNIYRDIDRRLGGILPGGVPRNTTPTIQPITVTPPSNTYIGTSPQPTANVSPVSNNSGRIGNNPTVGGSSNFVRGGGSRGSSGGGGGSSPVASPQPTSVFSSPDQVYFGSLQPIPLQPSANTLIQQNLKTEAAAKQAESSYSFRTRPTVSQPAPNIPFTMDYELTMEPSVYKTQTGSYKGVPVYETRVFPGIAPSTTTNYLDETGQFLYSEKTISSPSSEIFTRPATQKEYDYFKQQTSIVKASTQKDTMLSPIVRSGRESFFKTKNIVQEDISQGNKAGSGFLSNIGFSDKNIQAISTASVYANPVTMFLPGKAKDFTADVGALQLKDIRDRPLNNAVEIAIGYGVLKGFKLAPIAVKSGTNLLGLGKYATSSEKLTSYGLQGVGGLMGSIWGVSSTMNILSSKNQIELKSNLARTTLDIGLFSAGAKLAGSTGTKAGEGLSLFGKLNEKLGYPEYKVEFQQKSTDIISNELTGQTLFDTQAVAKVTRINLFSRQNYGVDLQAKSLFTKDIKDYGMFKADTVGFGYSGKANPFSFKSTDIIRTGEIVYDYGGYEASFGQEGFVSFGNYRTTNIDAKLTKNYFNIAGGIKKGDYTVMSSRSFPLALVEGKLTMPKSGRIKFTGISKDTISPKAIIDFKPGQPKGGRLGYYDLPKFDTKTAGFGDMLQGLPRQGKPSRKMDFGLPKFNVKDFAPMTSGQSAKSAYYGKGMYERTDDFGLLKQFHEQNLKNIAVGSLPEYKPLRLGFKTPFMSSNNQLLNLKLDSRQIPKSSLKINSLQLTSQSTAQNLIPKINTGLALTSVSKIGQGTSLRLDTVPVQTTELLNRTGFGEPNLIPTPYKLVTGFPTGWGYDMPQLEGWLIPKKRRKGKRADYGISPGFTSIVFDYKMKSPLKVSKYWGVSPFQKRGILKGKKKNQPYFKLY